MKKKTVIGTIGVSLILAVAFGIYLLNQHHPARLKTTSNISTVVNIDAIVQHPGAFKGYIGVSGTVVKVDKSKNFFVLGCKDACMIMPVRFRGEMPHPESEIIVYGEIQEAEGGKYIFDARKVKSK
ncbi:MAG: hypothetical protein QME64_01160 [bacterium]|nr:hypothetical protein [bacterium]